MFFYTGFFSLNFVYSQEVADGTAAEASGSGRVCTAAQVAENQRKINECNQSWEQWGINPPPAPSEMLQPNQCSGFFSTNTVLGCADALVALPVMVYQLAGAAVEAVFPDKSSYEYVSKYGTAEEIQAFAIKEQHVARCGEPFSISYESEINGSNSIGVDCIGVLEHPDWFKETMGVDNGTFGNYKRYCDDIKKKGDCFKSPLTPAEQQNVATRTQEIRASVADFEESERQRRANEEQELALNRQLNRIKSACNKKDKSWLDTLSSMGSPMYDHYTTTEKIEPEKFQACVLAEIGDDEVMKARFLRKGISTLDSLLGQWKALGCYNERIQTKTYCELAMMAAGGVTALTAASVKLAAAQALKKTLAEVGVQASEAGIQRTAGAALSVATGDAFVEAPARAIGGAVRLARGADAATGTTAAAKAADGTTPPAASVPVPASGVVDPATVARAKELADIHVGQEIQITSNSGNIYSGTLIEMKDHLGKKAFILKRPDGKEMPLDISRLNLNSLKVTKGGGPIVQAGKPMDPNVFEDTYAGQNVTLTTKSGTELSGEVLEVVNIKGEMNVMFKDGRTVRMTDVNFNKITGGQNVFRVDSRKVIIPNTSTAAGKVMGDITGKTGVTFKTGSDMGQAGDFYLENGVVYLNPKLQSDPVKLESVLRGGVTKEILVDQAARKNLYDNHGITVRTDGSLQATNPKTPMGKMVLALEKKYNIPVTLHDDYLSKTGSIGVYIPEERKIALSREIMQKGMESNVEGVLRHEGKHGIVRSKADGLYQTADEWSLGAKSKPGAHYAGEKMYFAPVKSSDGSTPKFHSVYQDGFYGDELSARLTQYPTKGRTPAQVAEIESFKTPQVWFLDKISSGQYAGRTAFNRGNETVVSYTVKGPDGVSEYRIDVPITGRVSEYNLYQAADDVVANRLKRLKQLKIRTKD